MKKALKVILSVFSILSFVVLSFFITWYYLFALGYEHHTKSAVIDLFVCLGVLTLIQALIVGMVVLMFKGKKGIRGLCVFILVLLIPASLYASYITSMFTVWFGPHGCSYTQDIANYGVYDEDYSFEFFPESITDDMTVVDFSYYYKYMDRDHVDAYLEVKFKDEKTMEKHLTLAKKSVSDNGFVEYQNPYNDKYTDVIFKNSNQEIRHTYISHDDYSYKAIIYSHEELTIIYNCTYIGDDIILGDDPDKGEYYPKILKRFGVEYEDIKVFSSKKVIEQ